MSEITSSTDEQESKAAQGEGPDEQKIGLARKRFNRAWDAVKDNRRAAREVRRFVWLDEQWGLANAEAAKRSSKGQSSITVNELKGLFHQVANDQRQNRPSPRVGPVDNGADPEVARALNGLLRRILAGSGLGPPADAAFDTAHGHAVDGGEGFFILETDWEDEAGREQYFRVKRVDDPDSVLLDPEVSEADFSDADWGFVSTWMDWEVVQQRWPHARKVNWEEGWGGNRERWEKDGMVRLARYRYVVEKHPEGGKGRAIRTVYDCLLTGAEILEETVFPCQWIAIFCVTGDFARIDGRIHTSGLFHSARGPQMMLNYYRSSLADAVGEIPKVSWVGTPKQFMGFEKLYDGASEKPIARLPYNYDPEAKGPPERVHYEADVSALVMGGQLMRDDIERTTGLYAAARGAESNEKSGKALLARQHETDTATFHYADNLNRAMQYLGRCVVNGVPRVYKGDDPRPTRLLEEDGSDRVVYFRQNEGDLPIVYEEVTGPANHSTEPRLRRGEIMEPGEKRVFTYIDPDVGRYDVSIATGPSYSTKRKENAEAMLELAKGRPGPDYLLLRYIAAENMDWEGADLYKEGLMSMMDDQLRQVLSGSGEEQDPKRELQRARAALGQSQQQMQQMEQALQELYQALQEAEATANDAERDAMVKVAVEQIRAEWQRYEADQATLRTALQQDAEIDRANLNMVTTAGGRIENGQPQGSPQTAPEGGEE